MESYDALIAGDGPAGLSAALILGRCRRRVLICGTGEKRNSASNAVHGLLGHEGCAPSEFLELGMKELKKYPTIIHAKEEVRVIAKVAEGFAFECGGGLSGFAKKALLATGLADDVPDVPGIAAFYGKSVHHCLYCDGFEHRDEPLAAYGNGDKAAGLALMMKQWSDDIVVLTGGEFGPPAEMSERLKAANIAVIGLRISTLEGNGDRLQRINFEDGSSIERSALFFSTGCRQTSRLWEDLGCVRDAKGGIVTDPLTEETTVPGVYVAGDVSRDVLLVAVAVAEGAKAGVAINRALLKESGLL